MKLEETIEELLAKPCWVMDILPRQVPSEERGPYFKIEHYLLNHQQLAERFANVIVKLNCYENLTIYRDNDGGTENPEPETIVQWVRESLSGQRPLYVLFRDNNVMLFLTGCDHYMTLFNPDDESLALLRLLAVSENLFVWKP